MTAERALEAGDRVLLIDSRARTYMVTLGHGKRFHSHLGMIEHDELIGRPEGLTVSASGGAKLVAFRPTLSDYVLKMKRGAQVVYPKDIGIILVYADIFPGARVLEAGTGSGALTLALARAVGPTGSVVTYEVRADHHERAAANVKAWHEGFGGQPETVDMRVGDIFEGVPEKGYDRMVLDLSEPWRAIGSATESLARGGILCCYLPTVPQVQRTVEAMRAAGFGMLDTVEVLLRTWNVQGPSVRPDHRMVAHTGFLIFGRRLAGAEMPTVDKAKE